MDGYLKGFNDQSVNCNGVKLHFVEWGPKNSSTLVLLHGLQADCHYFDEFSFPMASNHHVVALDFRGHGGSDKPPTGYSPFDYVTDIECIENSMGLERYAIVGHSLGAVIGMLYAAQHQNTIKAIVVAELPIGLLQLPEEWSSLLLSFMKREPTEFRDRIEAIRFLRRKHPFASTKILESLADWSLIRTHEDRFAWKTPWTIVEQTIKGLSKLDFWPYLSNVICPTLLIRGERGHLNDKDVSSIIEMMPKMSVTSIKASGHGVPVDNPKDFVLAVRSFLKNTIES